MTSVLSPFQQHREKIRLLQQDKSTLVDAKQSLHIVNVELERDLEYLKTLPCIEDKVSYKRETLLPKWLPQVEKYLQGGQVYSNAIFVYCTVWLFDIGDFDRGIEFAEIATSQNQTTPAHWSMTIPGFVCKEVFDWSESTAANGHSIEPYFSKVFEIIKSGKWRIYETDRADWYKLAGLNLLRDEKGNIQNASAFEDITLLEKIKELLITANALSSKVGVKTRITEIESRINALTK